jgi:hypothetical protein
MFGKIIISLFFISVLSQQAHAGAYMLPVSYVNKKVVQSIVAWDEDSSSLNPCYGWNSCHIGPDILYPSHTPGLYGSCIEAGNCIRIEKYRTAKEVETEWKKHFGVPWVSKEYNVANDDASCVGLFYINVPARQGGVLWPNSVCGQLPPPNQVCSVNIPSVIDFGTISSYDISGKTHEVNGSIECSISGTIKIYAQSTFGEENIYFNNKRNFYANLFLDGNSAWKGVDYSLRGGLAITINLKAKLIANQAVDAGDHSAHAVVYIAYL